jgi:hypothetical protein
MRVHLNTTKKGRKRGEKARKGMERKIINMHVLEACKARCKVTEKRAEKGREE